MEVADRILAALGKPESLKTIVPDRPGHDRRYVLDASKLRTRARLGALHRLGAGPGRHRATGTRQHATGGSRCGPGHRSSKGPGEPEAG